MEEFEKEEARKKGFDDGFLLGRHKGHRDKEEKEIARFRDQLRRRNLQIKDLKKKLVCQECGERFLLLCPNCKNTINNR